MDVAKLQEGVATVLVAGFTLIPKASTLWLWMLGGGDVNQDLKGWYSAIS